MSVFVIPKCLPRFCQCCTISSHLRQICLSGSHVSIFSCAKHIDALILLT
ncbi:hypothetical protein Plhal304r1_c012g0045321 [Plasmopara halstedii]